MPERLASDELGRTTSGRRHPFQRFECRGPRALDVPELRIRESFEREVVGEERPLPGLLCCLLPFASPLEGALEVAEQALHTTEQDEHIGR